MGFPGGSDSKESACSVGDLGLIPGLGWSPGGGHGNPLQYSCLGNPMDRIPWTEEPGWLQSMGSQRVGYDWGLSTQAPLFSSLEISLPDPRVNDCKKLTHPLRRLTRTRKCMILHPPLFSINEASILTKARWLFGTQVCHVLSLPAFRIKLLFLPQQFASIYWPFVWRAVQAWTR